MPEPVVLPFNNGVRTIYKRDALFVKLTADNGLCAMGPGAASEPMAKMMNGHLSDLLVGQEASDITAIDSLVASQGRGDLLLAYGAVNVAPHDLIGKYEGCTVSELLGVGGSKRKCVFTEVQACTRDPKSTPPKQLISAELGFSAFKYRPALGPEEDLRTVQLMREAVGPDIGLCLDVHGWFRMGDQSYTPEQIEQMAQEIKPYGITWLEEPLPPEDHPAYTKLRQKEHSTYCSRRTRNLPRRFSQPY